MPAEPRLRLVLLLIALIPVLANTSFGQKPKPVPIKADIPFGPHSNQLLDVYLPPKGDGPFPLVGEFGGLRSFSR